MGEPTRSPDLRVIDGDGVRRVTPSPAPTFAAQLTYLRDQAAALAIELDRLRREIGLLVEAG